jgi:hypothetical protein
MKGLKMKLVLALVLCFAVLSAACAKKDESHEVPPTKNIQDNKAGPYDLQLSDDTATIVNEFSLPINQDHGDVEFNLTPTLRTKLQLISASTVVTGCDANLVQVMYVWYEDTEANRPVSVILNSKFYAAASKKNTMRVHFEKLDGCTNLSFKMVVKKLATPNLPTTWDSTSDTRLIGTWEYSTSNGFRILLFGHANSIGWLESNASSYTCDRSLSIKTASTVDPKWIYSPSYELACTYDIYQDTFSGKTKMRLSCDSDKWTCVLPKDFIFTKD